MELIERKVSLMMSHLPDQELLRDPAFHQVARLTVLRAIMNSKRTKPAELKRAKEFFQIDANLTYLGSQNVSVNYVNPFLAGISVQSLVNSSRYVWGFQPSSAVYFSNTMSYGMSFLGSIDIPTNTSEFITGQGYSINFSPSIWYTRTSESIGNLQFQWNFTLV